MIFVAALVLNAGLWIVAATTEIDLAKQLAQLDAPTLLVLFVVLLYKRKIVFGWQLDTALEERDEWKTAALERTHDREQAATIAEAAIAAGMRQRRTP